MLNRHNKLLGINSFAIIEIILFLSLLTIYSMIFGEGDRFLSVSPHPFWIILLIIVIQYDAPEVIFCIIMMIIFLYAGNLPEQTIWETEFDYRLKLAFLPISWFAMAIILSGIKNRRIKVRETLHEKILELEKSRDLLAKHYENTEIKNIDLESRLASEANSFVKVNDAINMLGKLNLSNYQEIMLQVVTSTLKPEKFSIYLLQPNGLELKVNSGWETRDKYKKFFSGEDKIYLAIVAGKKVLTVSDEEGESLLSGQGIIAGPLFDKTTGEICGMLKFEKYKFEGLISKNIEIFKIISWWLGSAYIRELRAEKSKKNMLINEDNEVYSFYYLYKQNIFLTSLARRMNFSLSSIAIDALNKANLSNEEQNELSNIMMNIIKTHFRTTDEIFWSKAEELGFIILLPGTNESSSHIVLDRLRERLASMENKLIVKAKFSLKVNAIVP